MGVPGFFADHRQEGKANRLLQVLRGRQVSRGHRSGSNGFRGWRSHHRFGRSHCLLGRCHSGLRSGQHRLGSRGGHNLLGHRSHRLNLENRAQRRLGGGKFHPAQQRLLLPHHLKGLGGKLGLVVQVGFMDPQSFFLVPTEPVDLFGHLGCIGALQQPKKGPRIFRLGDQKLFVNPDGLRLVVLKIGQAVVDRFYNLKVRLVDRHGQSWGRGRL